MNINKHNILIYSSANDFPLRIASSGKFNNLMLALALFKAAESPLKILGKAAKCHQNYVNSH